jgi:hypothetical protein
MKLYAVGMKRVNLRALRITPSISIIWSLLNAKLATSQNSITMLQEWDRVVNKVSSFP